MPGNALRLLATFAAATALAGCFAPRPPLRPPPGATRGPPRAQAPRWQPVPARADGVDVPGGKRHIVKRGETGLAIARAYDVPWSRIAAANRIEPDATIYVGQQLFIPIPPKTGAAGAPMETAEERARAFNLDIDDLVSGSTPAASAPPRAQAPAPAAPPAAPGAPAASGAPAARIAGVPALSWPVDGRVILSHFGPKTGGRVNDGVNIKVTRGATVRAAAAGEVIYVGDAIAGFGLMILVRHPEGIVTAYAHLEAALVERGRKVARGEPIARAGTSGNVREPQLHFEVRKGRQATNPLLYLPN